MSGTGIIKLVRLNRGEELIGEVSYPTETTIRINKPLRIAVVPPQKPGMNPSIAFVPWLDFSNDETVVLDRCHVLCVVTPINDFTQQYNQMTGKIVVPSQKLILPTG
jgi:hypothetical protein